MRSDKPILVVEDNAEAREALCLLLQSKGYQVRGVANGREALEALREIDPFVILLDLSMPVMDGWQFCAKQKLDPSLASIAVVILSSESALPEIASSLGAVDSFAKPVDLDALLSVLRELGPGTSSGG
jgi:CheY-like chemotaxis protein